MFGDFCCTGGDEDFCLTLFPPIFFFELVVEDGWLIMLIFPFVSMILEMFQWWVGEI